MAKVDWDVIKTEYITQNISMRRLAEKYGVRTASIGERSKAEGWVEQREQFRNSTVTKAVEKTSEKEANRLAKLMDATGRAIDVVSGAFADEEQFRLHFVEHRERYALPLMIDEDTALSERQWTEEEVFRKVDTKALKDMTAVLKELTGLMRDFYNIPTPAQAEAQRIAAERLELDRRKALDTDPTDMTLELVGLPEEYKR